MNGKFLLKSTSTQHVQWDNCIFRLGHKDNAY
jgi:hypothetical protein